MKIYTKRGDQGNTSLVDGSQVSKSHLRINAYGTLDELNSHIGLLVNHISHQKELDTTIQSLKSLQVTLFQLGSQLACESQEMAEKLPTITDGDTQQLEDWMDEMDKELPALKNFILPGGHIGASQAHICRTVCRRCERICTELEQAEPLSYPALPFLNRLSDYFFLVARYINKKTQVSDVEWIP